MIDWSDRFWSKVHPEALSGCWIWHASVTAFGYGRYALSGRSVQAHRVAYERTNGPVGDLCVLHRCDVPACVNPDHLFVGTRRDNNADMCAKGRHRRGIFPADAAVVRGEAWRRCHPRIARGSQFCTAKIGESDVPKIREMLAGGISQSETARRLRIPRHIINRIARGKNWTHA